MLTYIVFVDDGRHDVIQYVGTSKEKAVEIYKKRNVSNPTVYDCWVEIWKEEEQINDNWRPDNE